MACPAPRVLATPLLALSLVLVYALDADWEALALRPDERAELWRPVTCLFVHSDVVHLVTNTVALVVVGGILELLHGPPRVALVFFYAGVGAALAYGWFRASNLSTAMAAGTTWGLVGASGAIYGLIGAHLAHLGLNWAQAVWLRGPWVAAVAVYLVVDVVLYTTDRAERVAYAAHVMGFVFGVLGGLFLLRNQVVLSCERTVRRLALAASLLLYVAVALGYFLA